MEKNSTGEKRKGFSPKNFLGGALSGAAIIIAAALLINQFGGTSIWSGASSAPPQTANIQTAQTQTGAVNSKIDLIHRILEKTYVDGYDRAKTVESMYAGLVSGIGDPYTVYMTTDQYDIFKQDTDGAYAGIGVVVSVDKSNRIQVVAPFEGYPGAKMGILPRDYIIAVNGADVYGDKLDEAVKTMKGEPGTNVTVTIYREMENGESKTFDLTITRETINMPTVTHKMLDNNVGYLRITGFERVTLNQFTDALDDLETQHIKGLILDLRNNPGGLLDVVIKITDMLVPRGIIVYTEDKSGNKEYSYSDDKAIGVPILILVNGNSASASEVLSGAVKDLGVGKLVGETTFGKGLVQNIYDIGDGSALKVTIARYYTPSGVCIQGTGIAPDYPVEMAADLANKIAALTIEEDVQLTEAVRIMNEEYLK